MASLVMLSAVVLLGLLLPSSMAKNVLHVGEMLRTGESLTEGDFTFIMQPDCNLVLYDKDQALWSSGTDGQGTRCFAVLQTDGNFIIFTDHANKVWESGTRQTEGEFILVLQHDGHVVIYGDAIWTVPEDVEPTNRKMAMVTNYNILYGGEKLNTGESLTEGDFTFIMQSDCNLVLYDEDQVSWSSGTDGLGSRCIALLQTDGNFIIFNESIKVWESGTGGAKGEYILVLQRDGHVVIYGDPIWIVPQVERKNRKIAMATDN